MLKPLQMHFKRRRRPKSSPNAGSPDDEALLVEGDEPLPHGFPFQGNKLGRFCETYITAFSKFYCGLITYWVNLQTTVLSRHIIGTVELAHW